MYNRRESDKRDNSSVSRIQMHHREEDANLYRENEERRYGMDRRERFLLIMTACTVVIYCLALVMPVSVATVNGVLSPAGYIGQLRSNFASLFNAIGGNGYLGIQINIYKYAGVALAGAALAVSGAVYQGSFRNALASPTTLGVQSGGVLGGTIYVMFFAEYSYAPVRFSEVSRKLDSMSIFERSAQSFFILLGCIAGVMFILMVSRFIGRGKVSSIGLILAGSIFGTFISGGVSLLQYWLLLYDPYGTRTYAMRYLMLGTFDNISSPSDLILMGAPVAAGLVLIMLMRSRLNLLVFGEDEARAMGIRVEMTRNVMVGIVTVLTAVVISFCGQIGFVGFIIPHIARRFAGTDFRYLIPGSVLMGASMMMLVYYIATMIGYSSNINFVTSLAGGTIFLIMIIRFRNRRYADWA